MASHEQRAGHRSATVITRPSRMEEDRLARRSTRRIVAPATSATNRSGGCGWRDRADPEADGRLADRRPGDDALEDRARRSRLQGLSRHDRSVSDSRDRVRPAATNPAPYPEHRCPARPVERPMTPAESFCCALRHPPGVELQPRCGTPNAPATKFCGECGTALASCNAHGPSRGPATPRPPLGAAPRLGPVRRSRRLHDPVRVARRRGRPRSADRATSRRRPRSSARTAGRSRSSSVTPSWRSGARRPPTRTMPSAPSAPRSTSWRPCAPSVRSRVRR